MKGIQLAAGCASNSLRMYPLFQLPFLPHVSELPSKSHRSWHPLRQEILYKKKKTASANSQSNFVHYEYIIRSRDFYALINKT